MLRVETYSTNEVLTSAQMNAIQDTALGIAQLPGIMLSPPYVTCGNGSDIVIGPIKGLMTTASPNETLSTSGDTTITPGSLSSNSRYYVYAYNNSGTLSFESSSTAPDAHTVFKSADTTRRYICSFATRPSAATIIPFHKCGGAYRYRKSAIVAAADLHAVDDNTGSSGFTAVTLTPWLPPHTRICTLELQYLPSAGGNSLQVTSNSDAGAANKYYEVKNGTTTDSVRLVVDVPVTSSLGIQWQTTVTGAGTQDIKIRVLGYYEA